MSIIPADQSPFDSIRDVDGYGNEHWRGRRLQPLMAYTNWRQFETVIERAIMAARNTGLSIETNFVEVDLKNAGQGGRNGRDYELSRDAAYLVAMNGDPRKPEVAAAQTYFVAKTRQAERSAAPEPATTVSWEQAAAIARIQFGLDVDTSGLRDLLSKGGILTKELRPHRKWEHLFWPLANRWEIHASVLPQLIRFAAKVRRELAAAEQDLQMSLPLPMSGLFIEDTPVRNRPPALGASVLPMPRRGRGDPA
jgi:hypothetical protein